MAIEWITYKGKQILYCDYHEYGAQEQLKMLEEQVKMIEQASQPVLLLVNLEGTYLTPEAMQYLKEHLSVNNKKLKKIALLGVSGLKKIIVNSIGKAINEFKQEMFATMDEAKEWLVS